MKKILKSDFIKNQEQLPPHRGFFALYEDENLLYCSTTQNIRDRLIFFFKEEKDDIDWISRVNKIIWKRTDTSLEALLMKKLYLSEKNSEFQTKYREWKDYSYLSMDFKKKDLIKIEENTQARNFYIGPFKNRFFIIDFKDIIAEENNGPLCEEDSQPCERLVSEDCQGFCRKELEEVKEFIFENYIKENSFLINNLQQKQTLLENDLQFENADLINIKLNLIKKYYEELKFLVVSKDLNLTWHEGESVTEIRNGLVHSYRNRENEIIFQKDYFEQYRPNEILAYNKSEIDERKIVYNYAKKRNSKMINKIYNERIAKVQKSWLEEKWLQE